MAIISHLVMNNCVFYIVVVQVWWWVWGKECLLCRGQTATSGNPVALEHNKIKYFVLYKSLVKNRLLVNDFQLYEGTIFLH